MHAGRGRNEQRIRRPRREQDDAEKSNYYFVIKNQESCMRFQPIALTLLRIAAGAAYFTHGAQKIFGWFGGFGTGGHAEYLSRFGAAGTIEVIGGIALILGLGTRAVAFIASGEMAVTYFWMHASATSNVWWWRNHGELPFLYCFIWLLFAAYGAGPFSLDATLRRGTARSNGARDSG